MALNPEISTRLSTMVSSLSDARRALTTTPPDLRTALYHIDGMLNETMPRLSQLVEDLSNAKKAD